MQSLNNYLRNHWCLTLTQHDFAFTSKWCMTHHDTIWHFWPSFNCSSPTAGWLCSSNRARLPVLWATSRALTECKSWSSGAWGNAARHLRLKVFKVFDPETSWLLYVALKFATKNSKAESQVAGPLSGSKREIFGQTSKTSCTPRHIFFMCIRSEQLQQMSAHCQMGPAQSIRDLNSVKNAWPAYRTARNVPCRFAVVCENSPQHQAEM